MDLITDVAWPNYGYALLFAIIPTSTNYIIQSSDTKHQNVDLPLLIEKWKKNNLA
jgi:hypothetical protein